MDDTVIVFTGKNIDTMFKNGGSGDWLINEASLKKCIYIIATANTNASFSDHMSTMHGQAFMIGKICGYMEAPSNPTRKIIQFSEYAKIDVPNVWPGHRNPVLYASISDMNISLDKLNWHPFPSHQVEKVCLIPELTIEEAKQGLAKKLRISTESIEIIIKA